MTSVYIHIPFCERICSYCDFPKKVSKAKEIDLYLEALEKEIKLRSVNETVDTLYIGGGTPSILKSNQLNQLKKIITQFSFSRKYEFSIECNPEHITEEKIQSFLEIGVNRVSLGVQTLNDKLLKLLNRGHNKNGVYHAVELLKKHGITNINLDFIFAIPFQTMELLNDDLNFIKDLNVPHISYYSLILEEQTIFHKWLKENKIQLLDNELEAKMFETIISTLKSNGYEHYEISNFAKTGYESKHNKVYWDNDYYYGYGMGASGYLNHTRYYNENHVNSYLEKIKNKQLPIKSEDYINQEEQIKEALLLGLRLIKGVSINEVNQRYHIDVLNYFHHELQELVNKGWIEINDHIQLTHDGLFYGNEVFEKFI